MKKFLVLFVVIAVILAMIFVPLIQVKDSTILGGIDGCYWKDGHIYAVLLDNDGPRLIQSRWAGEPCLGNW